MDLKHTLIQGLQEKADSDARKAQQEKQAERAASQAQFDSVSKTVIAANQKLVDFLSTHQPEKFPTTIGTPDVKEVVSAVKHLETALKPVADDNSELLQSLRDIEKAVKSQPTIDTVAVSNLDGLQKNLANVTDKLEAVLQAVKAIPVPEKVEIPAPVVNVPKTDLAPLKAGLSAVQEAIKDQGHFSTTHVDTDPLIQYLPADIDDVSTVKYFGYIERTGTWYIKRLDSSSNPTTIRYAFGNSGYDFSARAGLNYTYWGV